MSAGLGFVVLCEVAVALFVIWGFLHEDLFIAFEAKAAALLRARFSRKRRAARKLRVIVGRRSGKKGPDCSAA